MLFLFGGFRMLQMQRLGLSEDELLLAIEAVIAGEHIGGGADQRIVHDAAAAEYLHAQHDRSQRAVGDAAEEADHRQRRCRIGRSRLPSELFRKKSAEDLVLPAVFRSSRCADFGQGIAAPAVTFRQTELAKLEIGELVILDSDSGYYLLMRVGLDKEAWSVEANKRWFTTLNTLTVEYMLQQRTLQYLDLIEVDEELLASVNITGVAANNYY